MNKAKHNAGFTIVELMIAAAAACVLAITAGITLVNANSSWSRNIVTLELQRDATLAMSRLSRSIRATSAGNVTVPLTGQTATQLTILTNPPSEFRVSNSCLLYDSDTNVTGGELAIVDNGRLKTFTVTNLATGAGISIVLELQDANGNEITLTNVVSAFRN
ncbi:MAG: hypothetical protein KAS69_06455 [Planctomycetes bacterium]|nr:hypothetical protein [Planctomycetota bacterium]